MATVTNLVNFNGTGVACGVVRTGVACGVVRTGSASDVVQQG